MKRMLCGAVALLLLFGTLGCRIGSNAPEAAETDAPVTIIQPSAETTVEPGAETTVEPGAKPAAEEPSAETGSVDDAPFVPSEHRSSVWTARLDLAEAYTTCYVSLNVFSTGEMELWHQRNRVTENATNPHDEVTCRMREDGDAYRLETAFYETPFDEEPALVLSLGEVRLTGTDDTARLTVVSDPYGVFADWGADLILEQTDRMPYEPETGMHPLSWNPHMQPNTEWIAGGAHYERGGASYWANVMLSSDADGRVCGSIRPTVESERIPCAMLWSENAAVIVLTDGDAPGGADDLIFYGTVHRADFSERDRCVYFRLSPLYDVLQLSTVSALLTLHKSIAERDPTDILGRNTLQLVHDLESDGWRNVPLKRSEDLDEEDDAYEDWFLKLTKDGRTLIVMTDEDFSPYGDDLYAVGYVLLDADGRLESWGGQKPVDHTLADHYRVADKSSFSRLCHTGGFWGIAEDDRMFLLDDGRIAVAYTHHEYGYDLGFWILELEEE
ncbi:MAG: hypothetical protein IJK12_08320 [Clostridia bacterium]|nr:hypothetical protein [Clostridia bacterium]